MLGSIITQTGEPSPGKLIIAGHVIAESALYAARLTLAETRQALWLAIADLQGLMQLDVDEDLTGVRGPQSVALMLMLGGTP